MGRIRRSLGLARRALRDPSTLARGAAVALLAVGLTFLLSAVVTPRWPLDLVLNWFPRVTAWVVRALGLDTHTVLVLYGLLLTGAAVGLFVATEARATLREGRLPHLREHMLVRFLATSAFVVGFVTARAVVEFGSLAGQGSGGRIGPIPWGELWISGYHIHHFFYGFLLLVAAGWIALFHPHISRRIVAVLYGLGLGIFVDEWGLLVTMGDYHARSSWFAAIVFLSLLLIAMLWTFGQVHSDEGQPPPDAWRPGEDHTHRTEIERDP